MKKILLSCVTCLLALGLVTACDDEVEDVTPNEPETTIPSTGDDSGGSGEQPIVLPDPAKWEVGGTYLLGFPNSASNATELLYIDGATVAGYSYEGSLTDSVTTAVQVTVGTVKEEDPEVTAIDDDGNDGDDDDDENEEENEDEEPAPTPYTLSFEFRGSTYYITIATSGNYTNLSYSTSEAYIYWNEDYECWGNEDGSYFLCNNTRYGCLYASKVEDYITSSPIAALYDIPEGTVHEDKPLTAPIPGEVTWELDKEYFLGFDMSGTDYFFTGKVYSSNYGEVSSDNESVVPVTISKTSGDGTLYSLSFTDPTDSETKYLNLTESGNYRNLKWGTEAFGWIWDTRCDAFVAYDSNGSVYYIGDQGTYKELTLLSYEYISGDTEPSYTQYIATLYDLPEGPTTITISGDNSINVGSKGLLEVTYNEGAWRGVTWSSSSSEVATIDENGIVTGVGAGSATITASALHSEVTQTFTITITAVSPAETKTATITADSIIQKYSQYTLGSGNTPADSCYLNGHSTVIDDVLVTWSTESGTGIRLWSATGTNQIRIYAGSSITFDLGTHTLTEITISGTSTTNFSKMTVSEGATITSASDSSTRGLTVTLSNASSVTITAPSGDGNTFITSITVTYTLVASAS